MTKSCRWCQTSFEITESDMAFYDKVSPVFNGKKCLIPPPTLCPPCRQQRRLSFRNERSLYSRSDGKGGDYISIYSEDKRYPVYQNDFWWSDRWDALQYGREVDFTRAFFEQLNDLWYSVPMPARTCEQHTMENSDYCNEAGGLKNCYLCFEMGLSEQCYYSRGLVKCFQCVDCLNSTDCNGCYGLIESQRCFASQFLIDCKGCSNSAFCYSCTDCEYCFGSSNLRNKKYVFFDRQLSAEAYREAVSNMGSYQKWQQINQQFLDHVSRQFHRPYHLINSEDCIGDYISNSKNCQYCFSCADCQDCKYCDGLLGGLPNTDCMDVTHFGMGLQLSYESQCVGGNPGMTSNSLFSNLCWPSNNMLYSHFCVSGSNNCFGCIGLTKKQYCILNQQYTKQEYEELVPRIIEHMRKNGEWGEFFSPELSPFGYNETVAQEYFPLTRDQALARGFKWSDYQPPPPKVDKIITADQMKRLPDHIKDIPDEIVNWAMTCEVTGKLYRIIKQELQFYREYQLPIPRRHPDQRHIDRMALRNPRKLWERQCDCKKSEHNHAVGDAHVRPLHGNAARCSTIFQTSYAPDRKEIVYCEECYLKEIY